ncbi:helicase-related protein [Rhizobium leguminosarum]|nr:helicase-related protein [Rhizobium leguminosarum]MBY5494633.1 ATP-dependent helicase [Rhizobium leguminosarum]
MQLQSILNRIENACGRDRISRVGLSATLGDMELAAAALRVGAVSTAKIINGDDEGNGVRLQIRGYVKGDADRDAEVSTETAQGPTEEFGVSERLAADLFRLLRGKRNLMFAGSRQKVEVFTDRLRAKCDDGHFPNEFFAHHGSLSKVEREDVETRLRDDPRPTTAIATTTLELGIDIGEVDTVAQIGPGYSVASLRQRLGRSGRREGKPAVLRMFVSEVRPGPGGHPADRLNLDLVQSIAMVESLIAGWCEPPSATGLHLSTLLHQVLALILQTGGISAPRAWDVLCGRGPFRSVDRALFADLLRCMASPDNKLIEQSPQGMLMIGEGGERVTESHEFYPVFATDREYRILHEARTLGTYPLDSPLASGETIIFAGRRWKVLEVDDGARVITVKPTRGGKPPYFSGEGGGIHDHIISQMRDILETSGSYSYLDQSATDMLSAARSAYGELGLHETRILSYGDGVLVFPWLGSRKKQTLSLAMMAKGFQSTSFGHVIELQGCDPAGAKKALQEIADGAVPDADEIVRRVAKPNVARFDNHLSWDLMSLITLRERLDFDGLPEAARRVVALTS